jgi:cyclophilin family peptidyl-prolyl cis-trans isomerase
MGDYFDKETKQFLLIFGAIMLFLLFVYPAIQSNLFSFSAESAFNLFKSNNNTSSPETASLTKLEPNKDYSVVVDTSVGTFEIDLFEKSAPVNVLNFLNQTPKFTDASVQVPDKDFLFKIDAKTDPALKAVDEINADYLGLNNLKIRDASYLKEQYNSSDDSTAAFSPDNLDKYADLSVKSFYETALGYKYNNSLTTPTASKYFVYMASKGHDQNGADFFVIMSNTAPQVDGRYTPIGQVINGFSTIDSINNPSQTDLKVKQVLIKIR